MRLIIMFSLLFTQLAFASNSDFDKSLSSYEKLHQAFFDNDIKQIQKSAKLLLNNLNEIKDEKMVKTLNYSKKKLESISQSEDMEQSREAFNIVSQGLLVVLEKQSPNKKYSRYYCPMVKKYWIQNISESEKVMNPYASKSMPHCGSKQ